MKYETELPTITTSDDRATLVIGPRPSQQVQAYCAVTFSDKKRRYFTGTLEVDASTEGEGGLDSTPASNLYSYCVYLVPLAADDDQCAAIASTSEPDTGPSGYAVFRYIGRVRYSSGWIELINDGCWSHTMYQPHSYEFGPTTESVAYRWELLNFSGASTENLPPQWASAVDASLIARTFTDSHAFLMGTDSATYGVSYDGDIDLESQSGDEIDLSVSPDIGGVFSSDVVGRKITVSGCSNAGNNGTFEVVALVDSSTVTIDNPSGVEAAETGATVRTGLGDSSKSSAIRESGNLDSMNARQVVVKYPADEYIGVYFTGDWPQSDDCYIWANGYWDDLLEG